MRQNKCNIGGKLGEDPDTLVDLSIVMSKHVARRGADADRAIADFLADPSFKGVFTREELEPHVDAIYGMAQQAVNQQILDAEVGIVDDPTPPELRDDAAEAPTTAERILRDKIREALHYHVKAGIPIKVTKENLMGFPPETFTTPTLLGEGGTRTRRWLFKDINDTVNKRIRRLYPVPTISEAVEAAKSVGLTEEQARELSGATTTAERSYSKYHHDTAFGIFNNNPANMRTLLRKKDVVVRVPDHLMETKNDAIKTVKKFDTLTGRHVNFVVDIETPVKGDVFSKKSALYNNPLEAELSEALEGLLSINHALGRFREGKYLNARLGRRYKDGSPAGPQVVVLDAERDQQETEESNYREGPLGALNRLFAKEYSKLAQGFATTDFGNVVSAILRMRGKGDSMTTARVMALAEIYAILQHRMLFPAYIAEGVKITKVADPVTEKVTEVVELDPEISTEDLAYHIHLDEKVEFTIPRATKPLDVGDDVNSLENKAAFLLKYGFPVAKDRPNIKYSRGSQQPLENWAEIVIRHYFAVEGAKYKKYTNKGDPNAVDIYAIIRDAGNRGRGRLKFRRGKMHQDIVEVSYDASQTLSDIEAERQDLAAEQDIEQEDLPTGEDLPRHAQFEAGTLSDAETAAAGDPWAGSVGLVNESDMEVTVQSARKRVRAYLRQRGPRTVAEQKLFVEALKRVVIAVEGDSAPPHILEQTLPSPIFEHILDVARTNHRNGDIVKRMGEAVAKEEVLQNWEAHDMMKTFAPILHPAKPRLTEGLAAKVLSKLNVNYAPSIFLGKKLQYYRRKNQRAVDRLGLKSGDPASVAKALQKIARSSRNRQHRLVAELLLRNPELISTVKFSVYDVADGHAGKHTIFEDGTQMVSVNLSGFYGQGVESVLLHEYLHAFTVDLLAKPESELTPKQRAAKKRLEGLFKIASKSRNPKAENLEFDHAMESLDEFVATFFSSSTFQRTLKDTQPKKGQRSLFRRIINNILDLFGIRADAKFRDAFNDLVDFVNLGNAKEQTTAFGDLDTRIDRARGRYQGVQKPDFMRSSVEARLLRAKMKSTEGGRGFSPFEYEGGLEADDALTPEQEEELNALLEESLGNIPPSVAVSVVDTVADAPEIFEGRPNAALVAVLIKQNGERIPTIFVARENLVKALFERSSLVRNELHLKGLMESLIFEELGHISEFKAIPLEELDSFIDTLHEIELNEVIDSYTKNPALRARLKQGVADNNLEIKRQVVGEMLLMQLKRITRGYTTQEDIAFYESSPNAFRIMLRYIAGVFRKMYARYNVKKDNPELSAMVNRMAYELRFLANGGSTRARRMPFDPRDPSAGFDVLTRRFDASLNDIDEDTTPEDVIARFQGLFDILELPLGVFKRGKYQGYGKWDSLAYGDTDPRITELKKKERAFLNAAQKVGNEKLARFEEIRAKFPQIPEELISLATGTHADLEVDPDFRADARDAWRRWATKTKAKIGAGELDSSAYSREILTNKYKEMVVGPIEKEFKRLSDERRRAVDEAREKIDEISPELGKVILEMRLLVDAFSKIMDKTYGLEGKVKLKVASGIGVYMTRDYKIFNEEGFRERVLADKTSEAYTDAYAYMERQWTRNRSRKILRDAKKAGVFLTPEGALAKAYQELEAIRTASIDPIHSTMTAYLISLENRARGDAYSLPEGVARSMLGNLESRKHVPPALQKLLGVYGPEEGIQNIFRTFNTVAEMTARQAFLNNIVELGGAKSDSDTEAFMFTHEELSRRAKDDPDIDAETYVNMRTGKSFVAVDKVEPVTELETEYDEMYHYYVPLDMYEEMGKMFSPEINEARMTNSKKAIAIAAEGLKLGTGLALTMKTLGSFTFYLRNILGNVLFFGPAQGFRPDEMIKILAIGTSKVAGTGKGAGSWFNQNSFDEYYAELTGFNVIGTDLYASLIRDLLKNPDQIGAALDELSKLSKYVEDARKVGKKLASVAEKKVLSRLKALSQAVDSFYKIGYYEMEKANILNAKKWDIENGTDSIDANAPVGYRNLTDYDIKYLAAKKVRRTAQSYSDSLHLVEKIGKSQYMAMVTPFLRFKTEVFRIGFNTWKLSKEEIRSSNGVIRKRGWKRRRGFVFVLSASVLFPALLARAAGIGEDEDELLRGAAPDYKRFSTFWFWRSKKGGFWPHFGGSPETTDLWSMDMTFVNPFAIGVDPVMRFLEHAIRGDFERGAEEAWGSLAQTFFDDNIFLGAILDIRANTRSDTGGPIAEKGEGLEGLRKKLLYMYEEAFQPRTPAKLREAAWKSLYGGESPDPTRSPRALVLGEINPVKAYKHDPEQSFLRFLQKARNERNRASSERNILKSSGSLTKAEIRRSIGSWIEARRSVDERIYSAYLGARDLGLSQRDVRRIMSDKNLGMGTRRQGYLVRGRRERDVFPTPFRQEVLNLTPDREEGRRRLQIADDVLRESGARIQTIQTTE